MLLAWVLASRQTAPGRSDRWGGLEAGAVAADAGDTGFGSIAPCGAAAMGWPQPGQYGA